MIWPGIAEEQLGGKAHYVRAGIFDDVDIVLYSHISSDMTTDVGRQPRQRHGVGRVHSSRASRPTGPSTRGAAGARSTRSS